jgi:hypothetical protein
MFRIHAVLERRAVGRGRRQEDPELLKEAEITAERKSPKAVMWPNQRSSIFEAMMAGEAEG